MRNRYEYRVVNKDGVVCAEGASSWAMARGDLADCKKTWPDEAPFHIERLSLRWERVR